MLTPHTPEELAEALGSAAGRGETIALGGASSKIRMAGPVEPAAVSVTTSCMRRVLQYEPHDLTISVEAGMPWSELTRVLGANHQMVPLDPPFSQTATVGGAIAANTSGARRRLYGAARDLVIGMQFATLEGKLVQSGGMVVKNVAGLDMSKLMIGSFGTLAAIALVNFKLIPEPPIERSFLLSFASASEALAARNAILRSVLQPAAIDLLTPDAAAGLGNRAFLLALRAGGNAASVERYERELAALGQEGVALEGVRHTALWEYIGEYTPRFLAANLDGIIVRVSCTLKEIQGVVESCGVPAIARAGSGVVYAYFADAGQARHWCGEAAQRGWKFVVEYSAEDPKRQLELWPSPGNDLDLMQRIKNMFDPKGLLNRGRLYGRI